MPLGVKARIIAAVKNIDTPMLTHVERRKELEYRIDVCCINRGAYTQHL
jgi:hypothetical protein